MTQEDSHRSFLQEATAPRLAQRTVRVLIVEENENNAQLMAQELQQHGLEIAWQRIGTESVFLSSLDDPPDLILADCNLPEFSAQRALQLVQERGLAIPFLIVSDTIGEEEAVSIIRMGASDYVPMSQLGQLGARVARALQGLRKIAYFSMEVALQSSIPTYSGGLGVLAGDTLRAAADLQVPMVAVSLVHHAGYFQQHLDSSGWQQEEPVRWDLKEYLEELPQRVSVSIEGRAVRLKVWKFEIRGVGGYVVPVYLLDSDLTENESSDRQLTHQLYGGDWFYRLCQEMVLGVGGIQVLRALGYDQIDRFHMNEGHAGLLTLALLREHAEKAGRTKIDISDLAAVRQRCIFTTHTPVPAGHDQFPMSALSRAMWGRDDPKEAFTSDVAERVFGRRQPEPGNHKNDGLSPVVNMSYLALNMSRYINGVAKKHGEISRMMFGGYQIDAITNGVHVGTWTSSPMQALFDRYIPDWRQDNLSLRNAESIPKLEIWGAHYEAKVELVNFVNQYAGGGLDAETFTIGLARRATAYKRLDLLFSNTDELKRICREVGQIQVICSGKAHPSDQDGKRLIQRILTMKEKLKDDLKIAFIENYDMDVARKLVSGVDLWLNTPQPPLEASGTSGMKAAMNGVPSLSILDGWWIEGWIEGVTGWSIDSSQIASGSPEMASEDGVISAASLYDKLEKKILPLFYRDRGHYIAVMKHSIALNGSFFNTQRMLQQYVLRAYFR
jgi:glycogen phosphorylase